MNKQDKDKILLTESIAHWKEELGKIKEGRNSAVFIGVASCSLCLEYYNSGACEECPIAKHTARPGCKETPYQEAYESLRSLLPWLHPEAYLINKAIEAFKEEIDFLEGLLDELSN